MWTCFWFENCIHTTIVYLLSLPLVKVNEHFNWDTRSLLSPKMQWGKIKPKLPLGLSLIYWPVCLGLFCLALLFCLLLSDCTLAKYSPFSFFVSDHIMVGCLACCLRMLKESSGNTKIAHSNNFGTHFCLFDFVSMRHFILWRYNKCDSVQKKKKKHTKKPPFFTRVFLMTQLIYWC